MCVKEIEGEFRSMFAKEIEGTVILRSERSLRATKNLALDFQNLTLSMKKEPQTLRELRAGPWKTGLRSVLRRGGATVGFYCGTCAGADSLPGLSCAAEWTAA